MRGKRTGAKKINPPPVFLKGCCFISNLVLYAKKEGSKKRKLKVIAVMGRGINCLLRFYKHIFYLDRFFCSLVLENSQRKGENCLIKGKSKQARNDSCVLDLPAVPPIGSSRAVSLPFSSQIFSSGGTPPVFFPLAQSTSRAGGLLPSADQAALKCPVLTSCCLRGDHYTDSY